jgi:hypothetical protein
LWIAGPGTYAQTVDTDFGFRTSNPAATMKYKGLCGSGFAMPWTFKSSVVPDTCDEHTQLGVRAVASMGGNPGWIEVYPDPLSPTVNVLLQPSANYYILQQAQRAESTVPSTIGTMKFYDFRGFCPTCPAPYSYTADVIKYDLSIEPMWCPGSYVSTSGTGSNCQVDMTSHPTGNACGMHWELIKEGQITSGTNGTTPAVISNYATVKFWCQGWGDIPNLVPGPNGFQVNGTITQMRVEIDQPLRSDLDGDGTVTLNDFGIFKSEFFGVDACGCANYWPGQSMP